MYLYVRYSATPAQSVRSLLPTPLPHTNPLHKRLTHLISFISPFVKSQVCAHYTVLGHNGTLRLNRIPTFRRRSNYFISRVDMKARRTVRKEVRGPDWATPLRELQERERERESERERERESTINCRLSANGMIKCTIAKIGINVHVSARERSIRISAFDT